MESGYDNSLEHDTATVTKELQEPAENWNMTMWWKKENWPMLKKYMQIWRNLAVNGVVDAACLGLGNDPIT